MSIILSAHTEFPPHYHSQQELLDTFREIWAPQFFNLNRLEEFHRNVMVNGRYLALPINEYRFLNTFKEKNDAWLQAALAIAKSSTLGALSKAKAKVEDINQIITTTITGIAVPSLEARLMNQLPFLSSTKRLPLFGLGCLGGAAMLSRAHDYLTGHPKQAVLCLSVELCSLTLQKEDLSVANIISCGLFGDGAAAVLVAGDNYSSEKSPRLRILGSRSHFFNNSERVMGWDIDGNGFNIVLDSTVPDYAKNHLHPPLEDFLAEYSLKVSDIGSWIVHPGGPKVIDAMEQAFDLTPGTLDITRNSLAQYGNLSSTSVLHILEQTIDNKQGKPGEYGLLMAMGPGFCAEFCLLQWT